MLLLPIIVTPNFPMTNLSSNQVPNTIVDSDASYSVSLFRKHFICNFCIPKKYSAQQLTSSVAVEEKIMFVVHFNHKTPFFARFNLLPVTFSM